MIEFTVTVQNVGGANVYFINGVQQPTLELVEGGIYRFNQSHASNSGHPLLFSETPNGTHGGGVEYTTGVTVVGTPGSAGAYTEITVATSAPTLYYYCFYHSGMGGQANTPIPQAIFTVTVPGGTGGGYYIDGVQKPIIPVVTGGTFRFNQNDATNNNHPLILSTTTSSGGIISTDISYYLDGPSNESDYRNTSLFNAASVRYIQITVTQTSDFYYLCTIHGFSMGNNMDVTTDTWGALSWNVGPWGQQNNIEFSVTGNSLNIDLGARESWGQLEWNASTTEWGGPYIPNVEIGQQVNVTGQQLNVQNLGTPFVFSATEVFLSNNPLTGLTVEEGTLEDRTEVFPIGIQLNISSPGIVTVTAETNAGWGRLGWGEFDWGTNTLSIEVETTGIGLTANLGTAEAGAITIASPVGIGLTIEEGIVDPSPDAEVFGEQLSILVNSVQVNSDADVLITGIALEIAQGQAELDAVTFAVLTGQQLEIALNSITAGASAEVSPTGNQLTIGLGSINVQSWQIVNTGSDVNWNIIDTAA